MKKTIKKYQYGDTVKKLDGIMGDNTAIQKMKKPTSIPSSNTAKPKPKTKAGQFLQDAAKAVSSLKRTPAQTRARAELIRAKAARIAARRRVNTREIGGVSNPRGNAVPYSQGAAPLNPQAMQKQNARTAYQTKVSGMGVDRDTARAMMKQYDAGKPMNKKGGSTKSKTSKKK